MANIKDNKKGFKVIQISRKELVEELGQYGAIGICDYCNETASTGYYIAVLNHLWIDLLNTLKLRNGVQTGASIACGMMQKNVRKGKEIILLNAKMVDLT